MAAAGCQCGCLETNPPTYLPPVEIQPAARRLKSYRNARTPNLAQNQRPGAEKEIAVIAMVFDFYGSYIGVLEVYVFVCLKQSGRRVGMW